MTRPAHYPDCECPPDEAEPTHGHVVYALVAGDPPVVDDFESVRQRHPTKSFLPDAAKECQACGFSVTTEPADLDLLRRLFPGNRKKLKAKGVLGGGSGHIMATPTTVNVQVHLTWWFNELVAPHQLFQVVP